MTQLKIEMNQILLISLYTLKENFRNRTYLVSIFFGVITIIISILIDVLGGEQPLRIILDFGLSTIEFFSLLMIVFIGSNMILEEINNKTIYLILVRPISRWYYLVGKYLGLLLSVYLSIILMSILHLILLFLKGWKFDILYFISIFFLGIKIAIIGSLAIFFSLFSTSNISSMIFTFFIWILGHFVMEIKFLMKKLSLVPKFFLTIVYYIIPNFTFLNWRDYIGSANIDFSVLYIFIYSVSYCICFLFLSILLFQHKEF